MRTPPIQGCSNNLAQTCPTALLLTFGWLTPWEASPDAYAPHTGCRVMADSVPAMSTLGG